METEVGLALDSRTLRAIGQDLEKIPLTDFDLMLDGEQCVVRGTAYVASSRGFSGWWKRSKKVSQVDRRKAVATPVERVYLSADVQRLDEEGCSLRQNSDGNPDLYTTSQMLRVMGAYFESRRYRLVSLFKKGAALRFEFLDGFGNPRTENRSYSELYDFGFRLSLERGRKLRSAAG